MPGLILGAHVTDQSSDRQQLQSNAAELKANLGPGAVESMALDAGYDNTYQVEKTEENGGPKAICIQQKTRNGKEGKGKQKKKVRQTKRTKNTREKRRRHRERLGEPASQEQCSQVG